MRDATERDLPGMVDLWVELVEFNVALGAMRLDAAGNWTRRSVFAFTGTD